MQAVKINMDKRCIVDELWALSNRHLRKTSEEKRREEKKPKANVTDFIELSARPNRNHHDQGTQHLHLKGWDCDSCLRRSLLPTI